MLWSVKLGASRQLLPPCPELLILVFKVSFSFLYFFKSLVSPQMLTFHILVLNLLGS
jgi:hypothetical protein